MHIQGAPKKRTFRILTLQADASERSDSKRLESVLSEVSAFRMMIMKVRLFGTPCNEAAQMHELNLLFIKYDCL